MGEKYVILIESNFQTEVIESVLLVLVDFHTSWSGSTHIMTPVLDELSDEFKGRVKIGRLDIEKYPQFSNKYGIQSTPTFLFFKKGKVVDQIIGMAPKIELVKKLNILLEV
jgi:thioredoxin 1